MHGYLKSFVTLPLEREGLPTLRLGGYIIAPLGCGHRNGEYNLKLDGAASVRAMNDWPGDAVFSGFEIGASIKTGAKLKGTPEDNPVRAGYYYYNGLQNRESWDQTAVLYAVRGERDYWGLSEPGISLMHRGVQSGYNEWIPTPLKRHRYLIEKMPATKLAETIEELMVQRPKNEKGSEVQRQK